MKVGAIDYWSHVVAEFDEMLGEARPISHPVKFYERGDRPLEIVTSRQWYIRNGGRDASLNADCFTADGYFRTGDLGRYDEALEHLRTAAAETAAVSSLSWSWTWSAMKPATAATSTSRMASAGFA